MKQIFISVLAVLLLSCNQETSKELVVTSVTDKSYIEFDGKDSCFELASKSSVVDVFVDAADYSGVLKVGGWFVADINKVTGKQAKLVSKTNSKQIIIAGTIGKSPTLDAIIDAGKLDVSTIKGKWEATIIQVVDNPVEGVDKALVIAGSDKRGTMYGMLDISRKIGVSPWYSWADVAVDKHESIHITYDKVTLESPKVKYRGIFLNDEEPSLGRWAVEKYGGFKKEMYANVFELLLRQKGNFLWPAMWWSSFNMDDELNDDLADELGIVISNSHHEPMMRPHADWRKEGKGAWDYNKNKEGLDNFWREGIERMGTKESIVTLAMRGDGDEAMGEDANVALLERVVDNQRKIIAEVTGKPAEETPQVWALYKEVQEYYDKGMRVPDDVTLLLCDDNWGNVRYLPSMEEKDRKGGWGMYYHFDYVGAPRCYMWANTNQIERVWEQLHLTYTHGVDRIWVVNVGDLKPMELPIAFYLDYAWNPEAIDETNIGSYVQNWGAEQFGAAFSEELKRIMDDYSKYARRRTPELLDAETYSLEHFMEFERVRDDFQSLLQRAESLQQRIPEDNQYAYYQLVYFPIKSMSNLYDMYFAQAMNKLAVKQGRISAKKFADDVKTCFDLDAALCEEYHKMEDGRWNHIMATPHIGYKSWNGPKQNILPVTQPLARAAKAGFVVNNTKKSAIRVDNVNLQSNIIDVFNVALSDVVTVECKEAWVTVKEVKSLAPNSEKRFELTLNNAPAKNFKTKVTIKRNKETLGGLTVEYRYYDAAKLKGAIENNGVVSIEATNYSSAIGGDIEWASIDNLGRSEGAVIALPYGISREKASTEHLTYDFTLLNAPKDGMLDVTFYFSPTLQFNSFKGLTFGASIDDAAVVLTNIHGDLKGFDYHYADWWTDAVANSRLKRTVQLPISGKGKHSLKYWFVSEALVLQKIEINNGGLVDSYLGAPSTKIIK
ncbi:MAG: glycosyl hydrolase 115 family protein [Bacteroidales bacterium]